MRRRTILSFILLSFFVVSLSPDVHAKKWNYKEYFEKKREKERRFASLAYTRPNVYKDYVNNVAKSAGVKDFNAHTMTINEIVKQKKLIELGSSSKNSVTSTVLKSDYNALIMGSSGWDVLNANKGDYISFTQGNGKAYLCIGWGCTTGVQKTKGGGKGGSCNAAGPSGKIKLTTPKNKSEVNLDNGKVTLTWGKLKSFGSCCGSCNKKYYVYLGQKGKKLKKVAELGINRTSLTYSLAANKTYQWYVLGINTDSGAVKSPTWQFTVRPGTQTVSGVIWDSTDRACNVNHEDYEIKRADVNGDIVVSIAGLTGDWKPGKSGSSYEVTDVPHGDGQIICANVPEPTDMPNFRYVMECAGNNKNGVVSKSCATVNVDGPTTRDLGFRLDSKGWFTSLVGDVYGGCSDCADSISLGLPESPSGNFESYLINGLGSVFARADMSVKDADGNDRYSSDDGKHIEFMSSDFWPKPLHFAPPSAAQSITGSVCENIFDGVLDAGKSYSLTRGCLQEGIDNHSGQYRIDGDGFATVFVEADGTNLEIDKNIRAQGDNRILIMSEATIDISSDIGQQSPNANARPHVELGLISEKSINFNSQGDDDTTIIVEGPIVTKDGVINFDRDRGLNNAYPAEVVVYNPIYLTAFDLEEYPGVGIVNILWTGGF